MAKVKLENGKVVAMSELQKGDRIQTGIDSHLLNFSLLQVHWAARDEHS